MELRESTRITETNESPAKSDYLLCRGRNTIQIEGSIKILIQLNLFTILGIHKGKVSNFPKITPYH